MTRDDLRRLRPSLLLHLALALLGSGIYLGARHAVQEAEGEYRQTLAQSRELQARLAQAEADARDAPQLNARYGEIRKLFADEHRLDWIELIARIKRTRRIADVRYDLWPRQAAPAILPGGDHDVMASAMKLELQLLHEEDLLNFLADLAAGVPALMHLRECSVERSGGEDAAARLTAACSLDWITLREKT
ncbi:MAG: hypothetical protein HZC24_11875 [Rhodocyclales bacterium]|nr:hypothetical protein [Rhodocyclales bacterium]